MKKKKGINFPLGGRRDTQNPIMDTVIFANTFSSEPDPDLILKNARDRTKRLKIMIPNCLTDECCGCTLDTNPEEIFIREETKRLHDKKQKKTANIAKTKKKLWRGAKEIVVKTPAAVMGGLLDEKSMSHLSVIRFSTNIPGGIENNETLPKRIGNGKEQALKQSWRH